MGKQFHFTKIHAIDKAIELSKKEKQEVVVYTRDGEEFFYAAYGDYGLPDRFVVASFVNGEEIDFGNE